MGNLGRSDWADCGIQIDGLGSHRSNLAWTVGDLRGTRRNGVGLRGLDGRCGVLGG